MESELYSTLSRRLRPEDVAQIILDEIGWELSPAERAMLDRAAEYSLKRTLVSLTSMSEDFFGAIAPQGRVAVAANLFKTARAMTAAECADVYSLRVFVADISTEIHKAVGHSSVKYDRLNCAAREAAGLEISKRRYNKLFRFLKRFEEKIERYSSELRRASLRHRAKSGMAKFISKEDFDAAKAAAPFVAYYVAQLNRRSEFTNASQDRPFDEVAAMLFERFNRAPNATGRKIIAYVMPDVDVLRHLPDEAKMQLFADWLIQLKDVAEALKDTWEKNSFDRATMVVRPGNDSSSWNAAAGAWNFARRGWLGTIQALGMDDVFDLVCLGKAMRLMAADVARWHQASGGALHADTDVWAALPTPWEVLSGEAVCTRADVEAACSRFGVDPVDNGWIAAPDLRKIVPFRPTPELVHGVGVSHPELALMLRKAGWFSGRAARPLPENVVVEVVRDQSGAAVMAMPKTTSRNGLLDRMREWLGSSGPGGP